MIISRKITVSLMDDQLAYIIKTQTIRIMDGDMMTSPVGQAVMDLHKDQVVSPKAV